VLSRSPPGPDARGCPRRWPTREIRNAIFYVLRGGIAWRLLPSDLPPKEHCGQLEAAVEQFWPKQELATKPSPIALISRARVNSTFDDFDHFAPSVRFF
jgi:transposase